MKRTELVIITMVSIVLGTAMHFAHHLPFFNTFMGCIFPLNECVWEHMKMLFYPMLLTSIYLSLRGRSIRQFGGMVVSSLICIPVQIGLFYAYWIFVRHSLIIVDVIAYIAVMVFGYNLGNRLTAKEWIREHWAAFLILSVGMIILLGVLSYFHPEIHLFIPEEE